MQYLTTRDLAERYNVSFETIRKWRATGVGPPGVRLGKHVRYHPDAVERWEREQAKLAEPVAQ